MLQSSREPERSRGLTSRVSEIVVTARQAIYSPSSEQGSPSEQPYSIHPTTTTSNASTKPGHCECTFHLANGAQYASHAPKRPHQRFRADGEGATLGGLVQDDADITPPTQPKPYRALAFSTPSMTCLERRCGVVAGLFTLWLLNSIDREFNARCSACK